MGINESAGLFCCERKKKEESCVNHCMKCWGKTSHLTCCQDEVAIPGYFDRGGDCRHLKVLNEFNPALDVWGGNSAWKRLNIGMHFDKINCKTMAVNSPTSFFWSCLFFRSESHYMKEALTVNTVPHIPSVDFKKYIFYWHSEDSFV